MGTAIIILAVVALAFANGANDNFKGVATLAGSRTTTQKTALILATVATFLGSLTAIALASALANAFSGKGLVPAELAQTQSYGAAVALAAAATVLIASRLGMPISTTHSLVGALVGAGLMANTQINLEKLSSGFAIPLITSPLIA
ncbi:MAG TPA: inorganic phosphate transporter, partial [Planctomycetaceae bacterium]|nr:inorganic phosphate transporter [Planctomycetaceae bacterium]